jgi:predicted transcriptional regulator
MSTTTIRVSVRTHEMLQELARTAGASMQEVVERAVELYRRQRILAATNAAYAALQADPAAAQALKEERAVWDVTLADGLEDF